MSLAWQLLIEVMMLIRRILFAALFLSLAPSPASAAVTYSRLLNTGGAGTTFINAIAVDKSGNVYLTGSTTTANFQTTSGVVQPAIGPAICYTVIDQHLPPVPGPCPNAYVIKLDSGGNLVFATYFGGGGSDSAFAIAVDAQGGIYIAGFTLSNVGFPTTPGAAFVNPSGTKIGDGFLAKLNSSGTAVVYSTLIPGTGYSRCSLAVDANGNAYFGGIANPADGVFPATPGAFQTAATPGPGNYHSVVAKLNPAGSALVYATWIGGSSFDSLSSLAVDAAGNVYVTGGTNSTDYPVTAGAFQTALRARGAAFVSKLNAAGSALVYSTFLGGDTGESGNIIRVDAQGEAVVLGFSNSTNFPVTTGAFETTPVRGPWTSLLFQESSQPFVAKFNAQGSALIYSTFFDGAAVLDLDSSGNAYVALPATYGFPVPLGGALQRCGAGATDVLVARLDSKGAIAAASYVGGSGYETVAGLAVGADGSAYVAGSTQSQDFPGATTLTGFLMNFVSNFKIANPSQPDLPCMARIAQNGASFAEGAVAPGELITLRGLGFGPDSGTLPAPSRRSSPPDSPVTGSSAIPSQLAGVQVFFGGIAAPLLYVQSQQINVQVPWELAGATSTQAYVQYQGVNSNIVTLSLVPAAPALFLRGYFASTGSYQAAALNQDGTPNSTANPATRGSYISLFGTGGGATNPAGITGGLSPLSPLAQIAPPVTATVNGAIAEVQYAGAAPTLSSGLFQLNIKIPAGLPNGLIGPSVVIAFTIGGVVGSEVTIAVQ